MQSSALLHVQCCIHVHTSFTCTHIVYTYTVWLLAITFRPAALSCPTHTSHPSTHTSTHTSNNSTRLTHTSHTSTRPTRCHAVEDGALLQSVVVHQDLVTSLAVSADGSVVVTGSRDTTVVVVDTRTAAGHAGLRLRGRLGPPLRDQPRHQLAGHHDTVTAVAVSQELDLVVSGDAQGCVLLHSLSRGVVVSSLTLPGDACAVHEILVRMCGCLCIQTNVATPALQLSELAGLVVLHCRDNLALHLCTVNGRLLRSVEAVEKLEALLVSSDARFLLTGGSKGSVTLRWLHSLEVCAS